MPGNPSLDICYFGTSQPVTPPRILRAGSLTAELEAGNLRYIRFDGVEIMRAISFIVRDKDWGTYEPQILDMEITEDGNVFSVRYRARASDDRQAFSYVAEISGEASGVLTFRGDGMASGDFLTNRTGFVILHPIAGVAGSAAEIEHVDGRIVPTRFPDLIDPVQPMMDLRRLTHWACGGALRVDCRMEGDTFEMEDQRNWTDASYKTYVRPLALPWPYTLLDGERIGQRIVLSVTGKVSKPPADDAVRIAVLDAVGTVPPLGMGLDPDDQALAEGIADIIEAMGVRHLICLHDPRRGHDAESLERQVGYAKRIGAVPWLEAVITSVEGFEAEIADLGAKVAALGSPFPVVMVSPAPDMKCTLPGSPWPPTPPAELLYRATHSAFPGARIGGGMFSYFTELNRKRPPLDALDFVSFTTSALVHAGDDRSVAETLQALPAIAASARAIAAPLAYVVGPSAIGMRDNPYGEATKDNPANIRQAMNRYDPRQRGLLGAAWSLGYFSRFAYGGATSIALGSPAGATGVAATESPYPQPWFDEHGGLYPVFHALKGLAGLAGQPLLQLDISRPDAIQGLAVPTERGVEIWLANLTDKALPIILSGKTDGVTRLTAAGFAEAAQDRGWLDLSRSQPGRADQLQPYEILRAILRPAD